MSLAPRTALLRFSRDAQHQSLGPCSRSLHQCCSVKQEENSLACRCSHSYKFGTLHSSAAIQQRCAAPKRGALFTSLHQGCSPKQDDNSLACWCYHTYEFQHLTQLCCISAEMRSTKAWDLVHAHFTSVALQNKMKQPCLLVSPHLRVLAPAQLCCNSAEMHSTKAWDPVYAHRTSAAL